MTILVTGSSGRVGAALVPLLHGAGHDVRAASRRPERLSPVPGVEVVACDLGDPGTFAAALDGVDSVFLYAEPAHIGEFVRQARTAGVTHIVLLSSSSVVLPRADDNPIAVAHLDVERALTASPVEATFLRPDAFATNAYQWAGAVRTTGAVDLPYPRAYTSPIHEADIADAAFAALTEARHRGGAFLLTGPESLTFADQIAVLAEITGREIAVNARTPEAWREATSAFMPPPVAKALLQYWAAQDGVRSEVTDAIQHLTGHPARTFTTWARDHAAAFAD
ncbi:NAD(P)H-binding protein [Streptomyces sp. NBC_00370]|uniref:NAD(P)H-binding protein n=1 Tax=Streptomyces sp. NBC_00370 TaxID=2975728 RepID=UPI002E266685